ncbi:MAG: hypothetical protein J6M53_05445 [Bacteroidaceae bacterium]|nr:hypothetical protein [Bacteroidaceae bacterium]
MLQILINGKEAVLKTGTQIKFTRENPFFSEAGDYTLDVTFPLAGCKQNQQIFGTVHRPEMSRKALLKKSFSFSLNAGAFSLAGRAAVTSVSQDEIKLQLLAGKSAFNFDSVSSDDGTEKYIDELPLGNMAKKIYDQFNAWMNSHFQELWDSWSGRSWTPGNRNYLPSYLISNAFSPAERINFMHGSSDVTDCVFFPIYSEEDQAWSNELDFRYWGDEIFMGNDHTPRYTWKRDMETYFFRLYAGKYFPLPHSKAAGEYLFQQLQYKNKEWVNDDFSVAPQPYLCYVVEQIFAAIGYELKPENNALRKGAFKNVFIANARNTDDLADILPHWTVKQFFEQLQKFLNVMISVNGTSVSIESRNTAYVRDTPVVLRSVTDESSTDLDEEADSKDPTSGNVGYDFPQPLTAKNALGDRYEQVEVRRFASLAECEADMEATEWNTKQYGNLLYIDESTGNRYYVHYDMTLNSDLTWTTGFQLRPLDLMGPLFRERTNKIDTELKFVPCRISNLRPTWRVRMDWGTRILKYSYATSISDAQRQADENGAGYFSFYIPYLVTSDTRASVTAGKLNLQGEVERDEDEETEEEELTAKRDVIELAWNVDQDHRFVYEQTYRPLPNFDPTLGIQVAYPVGIPYYGDRFGNWKDEGEHLFVLRNRTGRVAQELDALSLDIDTRSVTQFQFTDNLFDPSAVVLIRGRKYVCQKLEVTIDERGLQPLKRGYFYEVGT